MADIDAVRRALRLVIRGSPADADADADALRAALLAAVHQAVDDGAVSARDRDVWVAVTGLDGWRHTRAQVAAAFAVSPPRVDQVRAAVTAAVADRMPDPTPDPAPAAPSDPVSRPRLEQAIAHTQAEAALLDPSGELAATAESVRRELLDTTGPRSPSGPASAAQRSFRSRQRPVLRRRVRFDLAGAEQVPPQLLTRLRPNAAEATDPATDMAGELTSWADRPALPGQAGGIGVFAGAPDGRLLTAAAQLGEHDAELAAIAWITVGLHWVSSRDIAALWCLRRATQLAGPTTRAGLHARALAATALRHHGYLHASWQTAKGVLRDLENARLPAEQRAFLRAEALHSCGVATPNYIAGVDPAPVLQATRARLRELAELAELHDRADWALTARRRLAMTEHQLAVWDARRYGERRPSWSRALTDLVEQTERESWSADPHTSTNWLVSRARLALDRGERDLFLACVREFDERTARHDVGGLLVVDMDALSARAHRRHWLPAA